MAMKQRWLGSSTALHRLGAFLLYEAASLILFGRPLIGHMSTVNAGHTTDPTLYIWCLAWWPYAVAHHINPILTRVICAPEGFNLAWSTSMPLLAAISAPITLQYGPVVALNLLALLLPALAGLFAFMLIRRLLGGHIWAALLGGYLFGFSPFIIGHQATGHVVFFGAFLLPAAVHLVLLRIEDEISALTFVLALTAALVSQFLIMMELCATMAFFGTAALSIAYLNWPSLRTQLRSVAWLALASLGLTAVFVSPLLYFAFIGSGSGLHTPWAPIGGDLLELLIPKPSLLVGELPWCTAISAHYQHWLRETGAYVGLPVLLITAKFFMSNRGVRTARFLAIMLAVVYIATLGTRFHFNGFSMFALPWWLFDKLPFLNSALPIRFTIYLHLILALIVARWITESGWPVAAKCLAVLLVIAFQLPNLHAEYWGEDIVTPEFFTSGQYRNELIAGENVMMLPYPGSASTWQALSEFYFAMPQGWIGPTPPSFLAWPIVYAFVTHLEIPDEREQLYAFLATHHVAAVVADRTQSEAVTELNLLGRQDVSFQESGGVVLARPQPVLLQPYQNVTVEEMRCRMNDAQLQTLILAADQYWRRSYPLTELTPLIAQEKGLLPENWIRPEDSGVLTGEGLYLGPWQGTHVEVGVQTAPVCADRLIDKYGAHADKIFFPYPHLLKRKAQGSKPGKLILIFDQQSLVAAATRLSCPRTACRSHKIAERLQTIGSGRPARALVSS